MGNPSADASRTRRQARREFPIGRRDGGWMTLHNDFQLLPAATQAAGNDPDFDLTGTGTVPAPTFLTAADGYGGILVATRTASAADNDAAGIFPLATSRWGVSVLANTSGQSILEGRVRVGASIAETGFLFGLKLTDTPVLATDDDQAYFLFDTDATSPAGSTTKLVCVVSKGGTDTVTVTNTTVAVNTDLDLKIELGVDLKARFYVNGRLVHTSAAFDGDEAFKPLFTVVSRVGAGAAKSHGLRFVRLSRFVP